MECLWLLLKIFGIVFCLFTTLSIMLLLILDKELGQPLKDVIAEQKPWYIRTFTKIQNLFYCVFMMIYLLVGSLWFKISGKKF